MAKRPQIFRVGVTAVALVAIVVLALGASQVTRYTIDPIPTASTGSSSAATSAAATDGGGVQTPEASLDAGE